MAIGVSPCRRSSGSGPTWRHSRSGSVREGRSVRQATRGAHRRGDREPGNDRPERRLRAASAVCWWPGSTGGSPPGSAGDGRSDAGPPALGRRDDCPPVGLSWTAAGSFHNRPARGTANPPSPRARSRELGDQTVPSVPIQSGVAQSAERPAVNRRVESSSLSPRAVSSAPRNQVMRSSGRGSGWPGRTRHGQGLDPAPGPSRRNGGARGE